MECNKIGIEFDEDILRNILYYKKICTRDKIIDIKLSSYLDDAYFYWQMYEIQVYFRWWISEYFKFFLRRLAGRDHGLTINEFIIDINAETFNEKSSEILGLDIDYYSLRFKEFKTYVSKVNCPNECFLEEELTNTAIENISQLTAYLLIMIVLLYDNYIKIKDDYRYSMVRMRLIDDYWFEELFRDMNSCENYLIKDLLELILNRYVLQKHDRAMYEKNDLRRCWFTKSGDRYLFQAHANSIWRPAKHNIIYHFLFDMKLVTLNGGYTVITSEGKKLYQHLKERIYYAE